MKDLHPIQIEILKRLLYSNGLNFARIKPDPDMENSQFVFHIDKLIKEGFVNKEGSFYSLTLNGKEFANRMDASFNSFKPFPKTTTMLCAVRDIHGKKEVLLYTRKKSPFYGQQGFPTQKVLFGDSILDVAKGGLKEETGLEGMPTFAGVRHYRIYTDGEVVDEDKIMYIFIFYNPTGELVGSEEGEYFWIAIEKVDELITAPLPEFYESLEIVKNFDGKISFKENICRTNKF